MTGLSSALNISVSSLMFNQTATSTISHNLANVNNPDFARQIVRGESQNIAGFGSGVSIGAISRRVDEQLQAELTGQKAVRSYAENYKRFNENIEIIFGTPNSTTDISATLTNAFTQLNNVANLPESSAQRLNAVNQLQFMSDQLNGMYTDLIDLQRDIDNEIDNQISIANNAIKRIEELNIQIAITRNVSLGGQNTNDLEDERMAQINILAESVKVNVIYDEDNRAIVNTESGLQLVTNGGYTQLERTVAPGPGLYAGIGIRSINSGGTPASFVLPLDTTNMTGGSMKALIDVRDTDTVAILDQIDEFSSVVIQEFNAVHSRGVGVPPPSSLTSQALTTAGVDLFAEIGLVPGSTFDISQVDQATGNVLNTTTVTLPAAPPLSGVGLAATINAALTGAGFPATFNATWAAGSLTVQDTTGNSGVVMGNDSDDFLGRIIMNPLFEGTDASTIQVRPDIVAEPGLLATARMRVADGGLSLNNNANAIELAKISTTNYSFAAAGGITPQTDSLSGYFSTVKANLAVNLQDNSRRLEFAQSLETDIATRNASVSGVNTDEELANLIVFQNAFQASSRVITTVDEMFDVLLNII
ncbi:MAG: flagellar hook-associated protein FlgK [Magnetococcales bacterium]|nr:flagellar hook-associated protein FlgK [Magnetococcales bacterium]